MKGRKSHDQTEIARGSPPVERDPQTPASLDGTHGTSSPVKRATPVSPLDLDGQRYLVAAFAEADWVKNLRLSGWGILTKGQHSLRVTVAEVSVPERAPILQAFAFAIGPDEPLEAYTAIADRHPIFRIVEATPAPPIEGAAP